MVISLIDSRFDQRVERPGDRHQFDRRLDTCFQIDRPVSREPLG